MHTLSGEVSICPEICTSGRTHLMFFFSTVHTNPLQFKRGPKASTFHPTLGSRQQSK